MPQAVFDADTLAAFAQRARETRDRAREFLGPQAVGSAATLAEVTETLTRTRHELIGWLTSELPREPSAIAELCDLLLEITGLEKALRERTAGLRFDVLARIYDGFARLRELSTPADLIEAAPAELCRCCDFDRAMISRVRGSTWVPEVLHVADGRDSEVTDEFRTFLESRQIPLGHLLLETELVRRRTPALVTDPENDPRTYKDIVAVSRSRAYVAAPIMPTGRVIGFFHADTYGSGRPLTMTDRDTLWAFVEGFGLIFEQAVLLERLHSQRDRLRQAFESAEKAVDELCDAEIQLARQDRDVAAVAQATAAIFTIPDSRIESPLTAREREVLVLMAQGATNQQIADRLVISDGTVKSHVKHILRKLRVASRAEAVARYLQSVMRQRGRP